MLYIRQKKTNIKKKLIANEYKFKIDMTILTCFILQFVICNYLFTDQLFNLKFKRFKKLKRRFKLLNFLIKSNVISLILFDL